MNEDTPEGTEVEMLQWQLDQLREKHEALVNNHDNLQASNSYMHKRISDLQGELDRLTGSMTISRLRGAGYSVHE